MRFYLTTAIDYVNSRPHLGTAYEKISADVIARYKRLSGVDTHFLMGNDEHSQNVFRRARELGLDPQRVLRPDGADVPRGVVEALDFVRRLHPHDRAAPPGCRAADGAGLPRRRRCLRRPLRGLVLRVVRSLQAGKGPRRRQVPDSPDDARLDPGEELLLSLVEVPGTAAEALRGRIPSSSSPRFAATRFCDWSRADSRTSRSAAPASRGAFLCRSIRRAWSTSGSMR